MHIRDLTIVASIATVTLIGSLALFAPTGVDAGRGKRRAVRARGVEMSIRTTRATRNPTARLTLVNTTERTVEVSPRIALFTETPGSRHARMVQPPRQQWKSDDSLYVLEPGETRTVELDPSKRIPRRSLAWFSLRHGKRQIDTNDFVARAPRRSKVARKNSNRRLTVAQATME